MTAAPLLSADLKIATLRELAKSHGGRPPISPATYRRADRLLRPIAQDALRQLADSGNGEGELRFARPHAIEGSDPFRFDMRTGEWQSAGAVGAGEFSALARLWNGRDGGPLGTLDAIAVLLACLGIVELRRRCTHPPGWGGS